MDRESAPTLHPPSFHTHARSSATSAVLNFVCYSQHSLEICVRFRKLASSCRATAGSRVQPPQDRSVRKSAPDQCVAQLC